MDDWTQEADALVAHHGGNAAAAIVAIAERYGISVAYVDRATVNARLTDNGHDELSEEEWGRMSRVLGGTDLDIDGEVLAEHIDDCLMRAGVTRWMGG